MTSSRFSLPLVARRVKLSGPSTSQRPRLGLATTQTTRTSFHSDSLPAMRSMLNLARGHRPPSPPRQFCTVGFQTLDSSQPIEEETFAWYDPKYFYPVRIGEVFQSRYQVIGKLGYGSYSTVWLCRDLVEHRYVLIKVSTQSAVTVKREVEALNHINALPKSKHVGRLLIRPLLDHFELRSEHATFQCLVHKPMAMTLAALRRKLSGDRLPENLLKLVLKHLLLALDFLHSEAQVIHTDIQEKNILLDLDDISVLEAFEKEELTNPSPRKVAGDRIVYTSKQIVTSDYGRPVLCDFGEARFGRATYTDDIQPYQYRAPEVILDVPWGQKVDIWSVGVMIWDIFEDKNMFKTRGGPENKQLNLYHLSHMVSLLGPPPVDFLKQSEKDTPWQYFDKEGNWIGATDLPRDSFEESEENLEGEDKVRFLQFVRKMVKWKPEERSSAKELLDDPWLNDTSTVF